MYADDLLLISSTCSDLSKMLRMIFSKLFGRVRTILASSI